MNLRGENEFLAVLMMLQKPAYSDITQISKSLEENMKNNYHENYKVSGVSDLGGIEITRNAVPKVTVFLALSCIRDPTLMSYALIMVMHHFAWTLL